jgi:UMF1 family MFS transporter
MAVTAKKRIWGWYAFDWASQPYATLLLTFIFGPYFAEIHAARDIAAGASPEAARAAAQAAWGWGLALAGVAIAVTAPVLGAVADTQGRRIPWILAFSGLYVVGAAGLWVADPNDFDVTLVLLLFALGLMGMEFATIFTNALLPTLGPRDAIGRISGNGWGLGFAGGVVALAVVLLLFAENARGVTLLGQPPALGLDAADREGTRFVGPFTALWFVVFMIPFFLWVRETPAPRQGTLGTALGALGRTLRSLPRQTSLTAFLAGSMFYRDALSGLYTFGGIYALGVLGWSVTEVGIFGIIAAICGAAACWVGGRADSARGPMPVIRLSILVLLATTAAVATITPESVLGLPVPAGSAIPDLAFYICGCLIGAAGGTLSASSRTMMVRQGDAARMTEGFGLYALSGKATAFLAPASIALVTDLTGSARAGILPLIGLFILGLILLRFVDPHGNRPAAPWSSAPSPHSPSG